MHEQQRVDARREAPEVERFCTRRQRVQRVEKAFLGHAMSGVEGLGAAALQDQVGGDRFFAGKGGLRCDEIVGARAKSASRGLVDHRPAVHRLEVEHVGGAAPRAVLHEGRGWRSVAGKDFDQRLGVLAFGAAKILRAIEAEHLRQCRGFDILHQPRRQSQRLCGIAQRAEGVAEIELAIAEGALAIFPGLAPVDRGQADPQARGSGGARVGAAALQRVVAAGIVAKSVGEAVKIFAQDIGFGGVQVAARRIAAQRPAVGAVTFPRRQAEGEMQQRAKAGARKRRLRAVHRRQIEVDAFGPGKFAERIGLRVPVQRVGAGGEAGKTVLGALVIGERPVRHFLLPASGRTSRLAASTPRLPKGFCRVRAATQRDRGRNRNIFAPKPRSAGGGSAAAPPAWF